MAIEADATLTDAEKARRRQELIGGGGGGVVGEGGEGRVLRGLDESLMCHFCMEVLDRPVSVRPPKAFLFFFYSLLITNELCYVVFSFDDLFFFFSVFGVEKKVFCP